MIHSINEVFVSQLNEVAQPQKRKGVLKTVEGAFAESNNQNRNGRRYSRKLWEKVLNSDYVREMLNNNTLFGEALHPPDRSEISLPEVSHVITELKLTPDGRITGKADILDTPAGRILNTVLEYGSKIGISSRGMGSVNEGADGEKWVDEESYTFVTFDFVPIPSVAIARPPVREGVSGEIVPLKQSLEAQFKLASYTDIPMLERIVEQIVDPEISGSLKHILEERRSTPEYSTLLEEVEHLRSSKSDLVSTIERVRKEKDSLEEKYSREFSSLKETLVKEHNNLLEENMALKETISRNKGKLLGVQLQNESLEEAVKTLTKTNKSLVKASSSQPPSANEESLKNALSETMDSLAKNKKVLTEMNARYTELGETTEKYVKRNADLVNIISEVASTLSGKPSESIKEGLKPMFTTQDVLRIVSSSLPNKKPGGIKPPSISEGVVQTLKEALVVDPYAKEEKPLIDSALVSLVKKVKS